MWFVWETAFRNLGKLELCSMKDFSDDLLDTAQCWSTSSGCCELPHLPYQVISPAASKLKLANSGTAKWNPYNCSDMDSKQMSIQVSLPIHFNTFSNASFSDSSEQVTYPGPCEPPFLLQSTRVPAVTGRWTCSELDQQKKKDWC